MAVNIGSAVAYLELDTSKFSKGFKTAYNDLKVFSDKSATAGNKLNELLQNPSSITSTPGYQFAYNQGLEAVNRTAAAKGQLGSGNRLYDLTKYGQGLASQTYNNTVSQLGNFLNKTQISEPQMQSFSAKTGTDASKLYYGGIGG